MDSYYHNLPNFRSFFLKFFSNHNITLFPEYGNSLGLAKS